MKNYIIAETKCSHDGSANRLKKIASNAIKTGFDAYNSKSGKRKNGYCRS